MSFQLNTFKINQFLKFVFYQDYYLLKLTISFVPLLRSGNLKSSNIINNKNNLMHSDHPQEHESLKLIDILSRNKNVLCHKDHLYSERFCLNNWHSVMPSQCSFLYPKPLLAKSTNLGSVKSVAREKGVSFCEVAVSE